MPDMSVVHCLGTCSCKYHRKGDAHLAYSQPCSDEWLSVIRTILSCSSKNLLLISSKTFISSQNRSVRGMHIGFQILFITMTTHLVQFVFHDSDTFLHGNVASLALVNTGGTKKRCIVGLWSHYIWRQNEVKLNCCWARVSCNAGCYYQYLSHMTMMLAHARHARSW